MSGYIEHLDWEHIKKEKKSVQTYIIAVITSKQIILYNMCRGQHTTLQRLCILKKYHNLFLVAQVSKTF